MSDEAKKLPRPSERDREAIQVAKDRYSARRRRVQAKPQPEKGAGSITSPHSDYGAWYLELRDAFGTTSGDFEERMCSQLLTAMQRRDRPATDGLNVGLAVVSGIQPENEIEAMLAVQMAATHEAAMDMLAATKNATMVPQLQTAGGLAVKLLRTFAAQTEALAKLRRGGNQTVRVEHVHVHSGGQAIVGNVTATGGAGGGGATGNPGQPHAPGVLSHNPLAGALPLAAGSAVLCEDAGWQEVPSPEGGGEGTLPDARGRERKRCA